MSRLIIVLNYTLFPFGVRVSIFLDVHISDLSHIAFTSEGTSQYC
jgi:hypothetical protein